jgi:hypothetical protein
MDQLRNFADDRLINGCIYCGKEEETRDHVPSRVFLDTPLPENLPVVGACGACNKGFSLDEEYFACLIESVIAGTTDPNCIRRPGIANILRRAPGLRARLEAAKRIVDEQIQFGVEPHRIKNVLLKLARGHAAFELSQLCREEPITIWWRPIALMTAEELESFDICDFPQTFGEIGSRGMQRLIITQLTMRSASGEMSTLSLPIINDWIEVQTGRYRYIAIDYGSEIVIRIVIGEYLACEVVWEM